MPREARIAAREAAAMPFPSEETTPPVTNTNLVIGDKFRKFVFYRNRRGGTICARVQCGGRMNSALHVVGADSSARGAAVDAGPMNSALHLVVDAGRMNSALHLVG